MSQDTIAETSTLLGVVWRDHVPHLRLRSGREQVSQLVAVEDWPMSYRLLGEPERSCIGHVPFRAGRGDYHDCQNEPLPDARTCERCAIVNATFASNLHHAHRKGSAELDAAVRDHLDQPNLLYVAAFRDGSIKIGTSTVTRSDRRLEEQGAWMARIVAKTSNGRAVRRLEDAVTERLAIGQSVSATRKQRGLISPLPDEQLAALVQPAVDDVLSLVVDPATGTDVTAVDTPWRHPMADHPATAKVLPYPVPLTKGRHDLRAVTAVGRHLLVKRGDGDDVFVVDPSSLYGLHLELGDFGSEEIAIQDSLF